MYILYDTETTGFPSTHLSPKDKKQARIIQLACLLVDDSGKELESFCSYVKPDGWTINPGAQAAHGISLEKCEELGVPIDETLAGFFKLALQCKYSVCHNIRFDETMLAIEFDNVFNPVMPPKEVLEWMDNKSRAICTMQLCTDICKLPFKGGTKSMNKARFGQKYKWPTLQEAHKILLGSEFEDAHDALNDVRATLHIFNYLKKEGFIK